jgi:hypothetical protein
MEFAVLCEKSGPLRINYGEVNPEVVLTLLIAIKTTEIFYMP